jgi:carboxymethylenebutenolidase
MGQQVTIKAADGHELGAYFSEPEGKARGGLVVVQEAFGVNAYVRSVCDAYSADGYACMAPAIYDRQERDVVLDDYESPEALARARELRAKLDWTKVLSDVDAAVQRLGEFGRVGVVGYCVGGSIAWLAALKLDIAAASAYYGRDIVDFLARRPRCPAILHFGEYDHMIPLDDIARIRKAYPEIPAYVYPAGHGFDGLGARGDALCAGLARDRTLALFRKYVG